MGSDVNALWYLHRRITIGWLRRSMRSPVFWIIGLALLVILGTQAMALLLAPERDDAILMDTSYLRAGAGIALAAGILIGLWRGTTTPPKVSLADLIVMMGAPGSTRLRYAILGSRQSLMNAAVMGFWAVIGSGGFATQVDDQWFGARLLFSVICVVLLSECIRLALWVSTEQVAAGSPTNGLRLRRLIRLAVLLAAGSFAAVIAQSLAGEAAGGWRIALDAVVNVGDRLADVPPMSLLAGLMTHGETTIADPLGLIALIAGIVAFGLYHARDFTEPIALAAERHTDPRGHLLESGSDIQWSALSQFGVSPRLGIQVTMFGKGPWALLWGSLVRWYRYQLNAAWISFFALGIFGVIVGIGVHLDYAPQQTAWLAALMFPFFGSVNMFMDEMRRQFLFLVPGSTSVRLTAAAVTSVLDGLLYSVMVTIIVLLFGAIPYSQAAGLIVLGGAISLLAQASMALVQLILPYWTGHRIRGSLTYAATGIAFTPSLIALVAIAVLISPVPAMLIAALLSTLTAGVMMAIAAVRFDYVEYSG